MAFNDTHIRGLGFVPLNQTAHELLMESDLIAVRRQADDVIPALERLALRVETLLRERAAIIETLSRAYRAPVSVSALEPVWRLAETLNPALRGQVR